MDKLKLLNLFVLAFLLSIVVQTYFIPDKKETLQAGVLLQVADDAITVPNIPKIEIINQSS
jgi:hypothetical protein